MNEGKYVHQQIVAQKILNDIDNHDYLGFVVAGPTAPVNQVGFEISSTLASKAASSTVWLASNNSQAPLKNKTTMITLDDLQEKNIEKIDYLIINTDNFYPSNDFFKLLSKFKPRIILLSGCETSFLIHIDFFKQFLSSRKINGKRGNLKWMSMIIL